MAGYGDLERNLIQVSRSFDKSTKNGRIRYIGIHPKLRNELVVSEENRHESIYVFPNPRTGAMWDNVSIRHGYGAIRRSGIKYKQFHCTRHTFPTKFLKSGGTIAELKEICGWSPQKMRYLHLSEEHRHLQQAINKMEY